MGGQALLCRSHGDLTAVRFRLRDRHVYLEHAIAKVGFRALGVGALGQRNRAEESSLDALGAPESFGLFRAFLLALAPEHECSVLDLDFDLLRVDSWACSCHDDIAVC